MLEVRNLKKVYKVKGGAPVYALNDVSLKFPETGLVFILGKSGSGKSTLLNVMGGLDNVDEGEIIIADKSSKNFSKVEMDSYRNTYLGFIFQEYNILSDFTVRENISLALELQHKKATDEVINKILEEVDLVGYGKRKPNELSGGQKQRVAIARALVKEPKIIFGDEPTGALDSNTGKQVFETLKKLSKNKLVVIVSHDRDFAEHFGDRVIELKDGVVISDISKTAMKSESPKDGLFLVGDNIIRLNKNRPLKADDLPIINKAIAQSHNDVFISADDHVNNALCEAAKIDKEGNREEFKNTDPNAIKTSDEEFKPIKSKFSLSRAFKMGSRSLKVKPFRLVMTILLSTIAFTLFGASLTMSMFSVKSAVNSTVKKNNLTNISFSVYGKNSPSLDETKIKEIEDGTGGIVYTFENFSADVKTLKGTRDMFHASRYSSKIVVSDTFLNDFNFELVSGSLPSSEDECAISLYTYYSYEDFGIQESNKSENSSISYQDVIGTTITYYDETTLSDSSYRITGIVDTKLPEKLLKYRENSENINYSDPNYTELNNLSNGYSNSVHTSIFTSPSKNTKKDIIINRQMEVTAETGKTSFRLGHYYSLADKEYFFDKSKTSIDKGEVVMGIWSLSQYMSTMDNYDEKTPQEGSLIYALNEAINLSSTYKDQYIDDNYKKIYDTYKNEPEFNGVDTSDSYSIRNCCYNFLFNSSKGKSTPEYADYLEKLINKEKAILSSASDTNSLPLLVGALPTGENKNNDLEPTESWSFKIVGVDLSSADYSNIVNISEEDALSIISKMSSNGMYYDSSSPRTGYLVFNDKTSVMDKFMDIYQNKKAVFDDYESAPSDAWAITINDSTLASVISTASIITMLTDVFLYIGIAMAVFSMLLFYNFISVSINNKKREIGILRAVGAKRSDVFKIFYSEAFIIALINFLLSTIAVFVISFALNTNLAKSAVFNFDVMSPNILVVLALLGISLLASIISSFLPVSKIANKKPIDAIANR